MNKAIEAIIATARESLADTRTALHELSTTDADQPDGESGDGTGVEHPHTWDDIRPMLAHARMSGAHVTLTETGRRADDAAQADLCFAVTREAVTNALRHAPRLTRVEIAWEHHADGGMRITVVNDGADVPGGDGTKDRTMLSGTGLDRLASTLRRAGGTMQYGTSRDGTGMWQVVAAIPRSSDDGTGARA